MAAVAVSIGSMFGLSSEPFILDARAFWSQPWRLVTTTLPHGSVLHLFFNLFWAWTFGPAVELICGRRLWICLVLVSAVASSASEFAFAGTPIGLSGVVYAFFAFLWVSGRRIPRLRPLIDRRTTNLFVAWFFVCIVLTQLDVLRVANIAHGVGAIVGGMIALAATSAGVGRLVSLVASASVVGLSIQAASAEYVLLGRESPMLEERYLGEFRRFGEAEPARLAESLEQLHDRFPGSVRIGVLLVDCLSTQGEIVRASGHLDELERLPLKTEERRWVASVALDVAWASDESPPFDGASFARRAHRIDPTFPGPWLFIGFELSTHGAEALTRMCYQTAAALDPSDPLLARTLEQFDRTRREPRGQE